MSFRLFDQIKGHQKNIRDLSSALENHRLSHCLIFSGPDGIGKKLIAKAFAQQLICEKPEAKACGQCPNCIRISSGQHENILEISPVNSVIKMEHAKQVHNFLQLSLIGNARAIIIDEAEKLNPQAANSLLKVLEEPPNNTFFFLITNNLTSLLATIRSRSQLLSFSAMSDKELKEIISAPDWAISAAQGSVSSLKAMLSPENTELRQKAIEILEWNSQNDTKEIFDKISSWTKSKDMSLILVQIWQKFFRDIIFYKEGMDILFFQDQKNLISQYSQLNVKQVDALIQSCFKVELEIKQNLDRQLLFENYFLGVKRAQQRQVAGANNG